MSGRTRHRKGRPYRKAKAIMHATYGYTCWICGHPGAGESDHIDPVSLDPDQPVDPERMRPAHGSNAPCLDPACVALKGKPRCCNQERGNVVNRRRTRIFQPSMAW